jgi:uncharacterized membrane protein YfcA
MTSGGAGVVAAAGFLAGLANTVAGGGSLVSFPALLAVGYAPLPANVTNTVGLLPGYAGGVLAYRRELAGQGARARVVCAAALVGAALGCTVLLTTPAGVFRAVVPWLVLLACALLALQRPLAAWVRGRGEEPRRVHRNWLVAASVLGGAYGAYFGAALGVMMLALLGLLVPDALQRLNALKGLLSLTVSVFAAAVYAVLAPVHWPAAAVLAVTSLAGGSVGGVVARRLPEPILRGTVVTLGVAVAIRLLVP